MASAGGQIICQTVILVLLYRFLIDSIGVDKLGIWAIVLATASAAHISELGLTGSVTRFIAFHLGNGDRDAAQEIAETAAISLAVVMGLVLLVGYPLFEWLVPLIVPDTAQSDAFTVLPYAVVSMWLAILGAMLGGAMDGCLRSDLRAIVSVLASVALYVGALLLVPKWGLEGLAIAQVAQGGILVVAGWAVIRKLLDSKSLVPIRWKAARLKEMFVYGVNFQVNSTVMLLMEPMAKVLLGRFGELSAAAYFEFAQRLIVKTRALVIESNRVVVPVLARMDHGTAEFNNLYVTNLRILFYLLTPVFALFVCLLPVISTFWLGQVEWDFIVMGLGLSIAWYVNSLTAPAYFAYLGQGNLRWLTTSHLIMGVTNLSLGLFLGNNWGWLGVLTAFCISLAIGSVIPALVYHRASATSSSLHLTRFDGLLGFSCVSGAVLCTYLTRRIAESVEFWPAQLFSLLGFVGLIGLVAWRHPMRLRLARYLLTNFNRRDV